MLNSFLQSKEWEEFQKLYGRKTWRADGKLIIKHNFPLGFNYLYCPRPNLNNESSFFGEAGEITDQQRSIFLKIEPISENRDVPKEIIIKKSQSIQPQKTVILDLIKSDGELLKSMHEKTRYNIRLAERKGIQINNFQFPINNFQTFWKLLSETAQRDNFRVHSKEYYQKLLSIHSEEFSNELFFAEYKGAVLGAALVNFYKKSGTAVYLHGASSSENRNLMAPYLLHWRIMEEAKKRGFTHYDLWGIDEKRWPGVTRFKMGFGGQIVKYPESIDVVYKPNLYRFYRGIKKLF